MKKFLLAFIPFAGFSLSLLLNLPAIRWLELKSIDWRFQWRGALQPTGDVVVVAIDEKSLNREGRWPWPRAKVAALVRKINQAGAESIEMDIIFAEADPEDSLLAQALSEKKNTIVGYFFYQNVEEIEDADIDSKKMEDSFQSILKTAFPEITGLKEALPPMTGVIANVPVVAASAGSQGYFNAFPDSDGGIRRFPLMVTYRNKIFPSMSLETYCRHREGFKPVPVRESEGTLKGISVGPHFIPTNQRGEMLINYRGGLDTFPIYSASDVLSGKLAASALKGKTILIGATAVGIYDLRVTPISPNLPGVLAQANLLDNLYQGDFLIQDRWTLLGSLGVMLALTTLLGFLLPRIRILQGIVITALLIAGTIYLVQWFFAQNLILSLVTPSLEAFTVFVSITVYRSLTEERQKRVIREAFRHFLHPDIVEELLKDPKKLGLGGQRAECTILFSDVRNFTTISEKMEPETLLQMMNEYFDPISQEIIKAGGYIDKFIGDAVMVIFGAPKKTPDHPLQACRAALAMQKRVAELDPIFRKKFGIQEFKTGIGIHTGPVIIGNIGTTTRLNYTVMGDTVNLASRLEGATKELHTTILISEKTCERVFEQVETNYLDEIGVKGKEEKIRVYEVLGLKEN